MGFGNTRLLNCTAGLFWNPTEIHVGVNTLLYHLSSQKQTSIYLSVLHYYQAGSDPAPPKKNPKKSRNDIQKPGLQTAEAGWVSWVMPHRSSARTKAAFLVKRKLETVDGEGDDGWMDGWSRQKTQAARVGAGSAADCAWTPGLSGLDVSRDLEEKLLPWGGRAKRERKWGAVRG